jgi:hypothetical protein
VGTATEHRELSVPVRIQSHFGNHSASCRMGKGFSFTVVKEAVA